MGAEGTVQWTEHFTMQAWRSEVRALAPSLKLCTVVHTHVQCAQPYMAVIPALEGTDRRQSCQIGKLQGHCETLSQKTRQRATEETPMVIASL